MGVAIIASLGILNLKPSLSKRDQPFHRPDGYTRITKLLIQHRWLQYDRASGTVGLDQREAAEDSVIVTFIDESYLDSDLRAFNSGRDRTVFNIVNSRVVSMDTTRHRMLLPFSENGRRWNGDLTYRPEKRLYAELVGSGGFAALTTPRLPLTEASRDNQLVLKSDGTVRSPIDALLDVVKLRTSSNVILGKAFLLGENLVVNNRSEGFGNSLLINGQNIPQGRSLRLAPGDVMRLEWQETLRREALLYARILPESPLISTVRNVNGRKLPITIAKNLSLSTPFRQDMNAILGDLGGRASKLEDLGVRLTLSRTMHESTQRILTRWAESKRKSGDDQSFFRAAITIMDAKSGEILSLASYPTMEILKDINLDADRRADLSRNHNLSRRPIGSIAKVPFATAIIAEHPELANLKIRASTKNKFSSILGIYIGKPYGKPLSEAHPHRGYGDDWIDFQEFLVHSSNRYAATLMTLATAGKLQDGDTQNASLLPLNERDSTCRADSLGRNDAFRIGTRTYRHRPALKFSLTPMNQSDIGTDLVRYSRSVELEHTPFVEDIESFFGVATTVDERPSFHLGKRRLGTDHLDPSSWRFLIDYLYPGTGMVPTGTLLHASPERMNLSLDLVDDYRNQFLPLILGSGYSRWTNIDVCQTFSRLVTGLKVESSLVYDLENPPVNHQEPKYPSVGIPDHARATVLRALQDVPSQGTAKALRDNINNVNQSWARQGYRAGMFGKTGTPALVLQEAQEHTKSLNRLIMNDALWISPADGFIHYRDTGAIHMTTSSDSVLAVLQAHPEDASFFRGKDKMEKAIKRCGEYNRRGTVDRRSLFVVENSVLVEALGFDEDLDHSAAFAFVFGRYPLDAAHGNYDVDPMRRMPDRALAVSIIFEKKHSSSGELMPLVQLLMKEVIVDALEAGW
jgi:cell division protein FtsI/penicillin-binding protein 2